VRGNFEHPKVPNKPRLLRRGKKQGLFDFDNVGKGIFKIVDKETGEAKGFAIFSFKERTKDLEELKLSLPFKFNIIS